MYYNNFVFYGSWREALEGFKEDFGEDYAKETLWNLMLLATTGEIETEKKSIIGFLNGTVLPNIKAAQDRYSKAIEKGKNGGRTKIELPIEEIEDLISKGKTQKEVAALYNVSVDTVQRRLKEYRAETAKPQNETAECGRPQNHYIDKDIDKDIDKEKEKENCPIDYEEISKYLYNDTGTIEILKELIDDYNTFNDEQKKEFKKLKIYFYDVKRHNGAPISMTYEKIIEVYEKIYGVNDYE